MSNTLQVPGGCDFDYNCFDHLPQQQTVSADQALLRAKLAAGDQNEQKGGCDRGV